MDSLIPTSPTHSRELLWLNEFLDASYEQVDQLKDGIAYNQILDAIYTIPLDQLNFHLDTEEFVVEQSPLLSQDTEEKVEPSTTMSLDDNETSNDTLNDMTQDDEDDDHSNLDEEDEKVGEVNITNTKMNVPKLTIEVVKTKNDTNFESLLTPHQKVRMAALENFQFLFKQMKKHHMQIPNMKSLMNFQGLIHGHIDIHEKLLNELYVFKKRYYTDVVYENPNEKLEQAKQQSAINETLQRKQEKGLGTQSIASPREIYGKAYDMIDVAHSGKITKPYITTYYINHPTTPITPLPHTPLTPQEEDETNKPDIQSTFDQATHLLQMKAKLSHFVKHRTEILQKATPDSLKVPDEFEEEDEDEFDPDNLEQWQEVKFILKYIEKALKEHDPLSRSQFIRFMITHTDKFKIRSLTTPQTSPLPSPRSKTDEDVDQNPYNILADADNHPMILSNADERFLRIYQMRKKVATKKREERKKKHMAYLHNLAKIKKKKKVVYSTDTPQSDPHFGLPPIRRRSKKTKPKKTKPKKTHKKVRRHSTTDHIKLKTQKNHGRRSLPLIQREIEESTTVIERHSRPTPSLQHALSPLTVNKEAIDPNKGGLSHRSDIHPTVLLQENDTFSGVDSDSEPIYSSDSESFNYGAPPKRVPRTKKALAPMKPSKKSKYARAQRLRHKKRKSQVVSSYQVMDSARSSSSNSKTTKKKKKKKKVKSKKLSTSSPLIPSSSPLPKRKHRSPNVRLPPGNLPDMNEIYRKVALIPPEEMQRQRNGYVQDLLFSYFHSDTSMQAKSRREKRHDISPFAVDPEESTTLHKAFPSSTTKKHKSRQKSNPFEEFEMSESVDLDAIMSPSKIPPIPTYSPKV